jgi:hypothetical protein
MIARMRAATPIGLAKQDQRTQIHRPNYKRRRRCGLCPADKQSLAQPAMTELGQTEKKRVQLGFVGFAFDSGQVA